MPDRRPALQNVVCNQAADPADVDVGLEIELEPGAVGEGEDELSVYSDRTMIFIRLAADKFPLRNALRPFSARLGANQVRMAEKPVKNMTFWVFCDRYGRMREIWMQKCAESADSRLFSAGRPL